ncbi:type I methionyl aminopeptidase [bacterium]|nr:type I methionyl aminopeptidase [bacterium]
MIKAKPGQHAGLIKSREELDIMRDAGRKLARVREELAKAVGPGITTLDLDRQAREMIEDMGARPAFLGYRGYPATICASVNEEVVHGIPSAGRKLNEGDLISLDVGLIHEGFYSDTAITVAVGQVTPEIERLIGTTREALKAGIEAARAGNRLGDVSAAIQNQVESSGFSVVREYTGHGIGREMHEEPRIKNYGRPDSGLRLRAGMVLALEPMVNIGVWNTRVLDDEWTVVTADGKPSAHFEHTIAVTENGAEILTKV